MNPILIVPRIYYVMSMESKEETLAYYLENYTPENRIGFCKLALSKYHFEKYSLRVKENDIAFEDRIVQDNETREHLHNIINNGSCSVDEFKTVFNMLTLDQITYIGF